jgi:ribosomal protein S18 acetylase RimI-like enzyme
MDFYQARAVSQGMTALSLHVRTENVRAQRFYAHLGFEFSDCSASGYLSMEKKI